MQDQRVEPATEESTGGAAQQEADNVQDTSHMDEGATTDSETEVDAVSVMRVDHDVAREVERQFLERIAPGQQAQVAQALHFPHNGGAGLRAWLNCMIAGSEVLPARVPPDVIEVFLRHSDARPLHDCEDCGLVLPVIPNRNYGFELDPERVFFERCPNCGGRVGWHYYWLKRRRRQ